MTDISAGLPAIISRALEASASRHERLCPRQVLGVRMGFAAALVLDLPLPRTDKRLITLVETDGCFADGVEAATGCSLGHRTLRLIDCGRVAATFIDVDTGTAIRVAPSGQSRQHAATFCPDEPRRYYAQQRAYQLMPDADLLRIEAVALDFSLDAMLGKKGVRVTCTLCGEEVINGRERAGAAGPLCPACAGGGYYRVVPGEAHLAVPSPRPAAATRWPRQEWGVR